jgi:L-glutamine-phosphate cytidylyltransferase
MSTATAIILAAGRGSRMGVVTATQPKCLATLAGRGLLDWQLAALSAVGIGRTVLVGGYRLDQLRGKGYQVIENPRWAHTNMLASLLCARTLLIRGSCLVLYSDVVFHPDIVQTLLRSDEPIAITYDQRWASLWHERFDDPLQDAETFRLKGTRLLEIGRRATHLADVQGQYMGLLRFSPRGWDVVERFLATRPQADIDALDMTALLGRLVATGADVAALPVDGRWCEVDSRQDLKLYEARIASVDAGTQDWTHDWRWARAPDRSLP